MDIYFILLYSGYGADDPQQTCQIEGLSQVRSGLDLFAAGSELQNSAGICSCRITEFVSAIAEHESPKKSTEYLSASSRQGSQCQKLLEMRSFLERFAIKSVLLISIHVMSALRNDLGRGSAVALHCRPGQIWPDLPVARPQDIPKRPTHNGFCHHFPHMAMDQYLYIPFLGGCNIHLPAILMFTTLPYFNGCLEAHAGRTRCVLPRLEG